MIVEYKKSDFISFSYLYDKKISAIVFVIGNYSITLHRLNNNNPD